MGFVVDTYMTETRGKREYHQLITDRVGDGFTLTARVHGEAVQAQEVVHELFREDLDELIQHLLKLRNKGVETLSRPRHDSRASSSDPELQRLIAEEEAIERKTRGL